MIRVSNGSKYQMMLALQTLHQGHVLRFYAGAPPVSASNAPTGAYLGYVTRDDLPVGAGNGIGLLLSTNSYITNDPTQVLKLKGIATGVAGYARLSAYDDTLADSPTAARIDFEVNGSDNNGVIISTPNIVPGLSQMVSGFFYTIPG